MFEQGFQTEVGIVKAVHLQTGIVVHMTFPFSFAGAEAYEIVCVR